jgi:hypothetical protein
VIEMRWLVLAILLGCGGHHFKPAEAREIETTAVKVGSAAPAVELVTASGKSLKLAEVIASHDKTVVTFYRGFY